VCASRQPHRWLLLLLLLSLLAPMTARAGEGEEDAIAVFDRLAQRERVLEGQKAALADVTRQRSLFAYRLLRRRDLGFAANPETRLEDAHALDLALVALGRGSEETHAVDSELIRLRDERTALENALLGQSLGNVPADEEADRRRAAKARDGSRIQRPVRGVALAVPGLRRDGPSKIVLRHDSVQLLTRLGEVVHAVKAGTVRRVEGLRQGGFAIVTEHAGGLTSILTGLRDIAVKPGDKVDEGQTVGLAGRNLDGATVLSIELWRGRRPVDVAKLLRVYL
jgi:hypothetical protein